MVKTVKSRGQVAPLTTTTPPAQPLRTLNTTSKRGSVPTADTSGYPAFPNGTTTADTKPSATVTGMSFGPKPSTISSLTFSGKPSKVLSTLTIENPGKHDISIKITKSFNVLRLLMLALFRFPFTLVKAPNGTFSYIYNWKSFQAIGCHIINGVLSILLLLCVINYFGLSLNYPPQERLAGEPMRNLHNEEVYLLHRNSSHITVICLLAHLVLAGWALFFKRDLVVKYLTFWSYASEFMCINVAEGLGKYMKIVVFSYIGIELIISAVISVRFVPESSGTPCIFAMLVLRPFYPAIHTASNFWIFRAVFTGILVYIRISANIYMLFFLFQCKLLKRVLLEWNQRLGIVVKEEIEELQGKPTTTTRTRYSQVFKDYVCMLDLMEGTDKVFSTVLESYYGAQILSTCFQIFHLFSTFFNKAEFQTIRRLDAITLVLYLAQCYGVFFLATKVAVDVGSEATRCVETLRVKGMLGKKSDEEAYFLLSLNVANDGYFQTAISGGRFFLLDEPCLLAIVATIFTYVILIIQFTYIFKANYEGDKSNINSNATLQKILANAEGTRNIFNFPKEVFIVK